MKPYRNFYPFLDGAEYRSGSSSNKTIKFEQPPDAITPLLIFLCTFATSNRVALKKISIFLFVAAALIMLFERCAKIPGSITGGAKDEVPPQFLHSTPPNYSLDFKAKRIDITFDEYLQLKDAAGQFYSSPPIKKQPEILLYGKTVRISLKEPLLPDVTYSFDFGEAIVDNNEGNKLTDFLYVFSTGDHIDSLTFTGRILNAFDLMPRKKDDKVPVSVLLFDDLSDSAVYKHTPAYVARADQFGFFTFSHLRPDTFRIFALRDMGNNLRFDMPTEQIAFSDTLIVMDQRYYHHPEAPFFTSRSLPDSLKEKNPGLLHQDIRLYQFQEEPTKQYRIAYERKEANMLRFVYSMPIDSLGIKVQDYESTGKWFEFESSRNRDTLDYWLTDTALVHRKDILVTVNSPKTDSLNRLVYATDTLKMSFEPPKPPADKRSRKERKEDEKNPKPKPRTPLEMMLITSNVKSGGTMDLTERMQLTASQPIRATDRSRIILQEMVDTVKQPVAYTFIRDSVNVRKCYVDWKLKEDTKYFLTIDTMSFTSIYGVFNDSTGFNFTSQKKDYYSSIEVTFDSVPCPLAVQVIKGDKEDVVKQVRLTEGKVAFIDFLKPDKYRLKVIFDRNSNGKWDTGNYKAKIQPEKVGYHPEPEIETRSGWKTDVQWTLREENQVNNKNEIPKKDEHNEK